MNGELERKNGTIQCTLTWQRVQGWSSLNPIEYEHPTNHRLPRKKASEQYWSLFMKRYILVRHVPFERKRSNLPQPEICKLSENGLYERGSFGNCSETGCTSTRCQPLVNSLPEFLRNHHRELLDNTGSGFTISTRTRRSQTSGHIVGETLSPPICAKESQKA